MSTPAKAALVTAFVLAFIIYGSLYPFALRPGSLAGDPVGALLRSWADPPSGRGDLIANLALYMPLGLFAAPALAERLRPLAALAATTLAGLALSVSVELAQFYVIGRVTNMSDVYLNSAGTLLGGVGGLLLAGPAVAGTQRWRGWAPHPFAALLIGSWLGYRLYPFVPTIDLHKYWNSLKPIVLWPHVDPLRLWYLAVSWWALAALTEAVVARGAVILAAALPAGVLIGQIFILDRFLSLDEMLGMAVAGLAWLAFRRSPRAQAAMLAALMCGVIVHQRLEPFDFGGGTQPFRWTPFYSLIHGNMGIGVQSALQKFFLYGSLFWFMAEAGVTWIAAAIAESALLFATSFAQTYMPGRSAEATDAFLGLIVAFLCASFDSSRRLARVAHPRRVQT